MHTNVVSFCLSSYLCVFSYSVDSFLVIIIWSGIAHDLMYRVRPYSSAVSNSLIPVVAVSVQHWDQASVSQTPSERVISSVCEGCFDFFVSVHIEGCFMM